MRQGTPCNLTMLSMATSFLQSLPAAVVGVPLAVPPNRACWLWQEDDGSRFDLQPVWQIEDLCGSQHHRHFEAALRTRKAHLPICGFHEHVCERRDRAPMSLAMESQSLCKPSGTVLLRGRELLSYCFLLPFRCL